VTTSTNRPPYEADAAITGTFVGRIGLAACIFDRNPA
jgi:hypothetical protein